ncbi:hypothetical protein [Pseudomonas avellanae]|uniref:hypothetical protein n=1 Tax=Pseudomonas avellanae TaxID=46257 RepID=UPI00201B6089|nr:hypothetical protein [Pseudomonas avellanae]UQW67997.1 hypothetical protein L2Y00_22505 [Pseudomonas avellanae]
MSITTTCIDLSNLISEPMEPAHDLKNQYSFCYPGCTSGNRIFVAADTTAGHGKTD